MAITSPYMGLKVWNLLTDPYDHAQLADNWAKVDQHDHSIGKGTQIPTGGIADGAVTAIKIDPAALPTLSLADNSVTTTKIVNAAVTTGKLATGAVTSGIIADGTIQTADIGANQITTTLIADDAVTSAKLKDDASTDSNRAVTTDHIRDGAVTASKVNSALAGYLGVTTPSAIAGGFLSIPGNETTTSTTYTKLTTNDQIANIVVPTNGKLRIGYQALWKLVGASNDGSITIFLNGNEITTLTANAVPAGIGTALSKTSVNYGFARTASTGLVVGASTSVDSTVVTTGMVAPHTEVTVAAGTYTVSVQYKVNVTTGGTLNVKNRLLWVEGRGF